MKQVLSFSTQSDRAKVSQLRATVGTAKLYRMLHFVLFCFVFLSGTSAFAQAPTLTSTESRCLADGTVTVVGNSAFLNILTGPGIPGQAGPFSGSSVTFDKLERGTFTLTQIDPNTNAETTYKVDVPGNYKENWFFTAQVQYSACTGGSPTVKIGNFTITDASSAQQRGPYTYRISSKDGVLSTDPNASPAFQSVSEFPILYPSGVGGSYEIQSMDACGNFKTVTINIPAFAPGPNVSASFVQFNNCAGDADYKISASNGTAPYTFTITAGPDQVGSSITGSDATFTLAAGGTYTISATDQCGGKTDRTVNVKPYTAPNVNLYNGYGVCDPNGGAGTGSVNVNVDLSTVSKGPVTVSMTSASNCTQVSPINYPLDGSLSQVTFGNLIRPCTYTFTVTDGCNRTISREVNLAAPAAGALECYKNIECPSDGSINYRLKVGTFGNSYTATVPLIYEIIDSTTNTSVTGYPVSINNYAEIYPELSKGKYYIKITDACGATCRDSVFIPEYRLPTVSIDLMSSCISAGQANVMGVNNQGLNSLKKYTYKIVEGPTRVGEGPEPDSPTNTGRFSGLQSGGTYKFSFNDGCKTIFTSLTVPAYEQPTWEVGYGALCFDKMAADLQVINLQPAGKVVGPYKWQIIGTDSDLYGSTAPYNGTLPYPNSAGQIDSTFANLPSKANRSLATYTILGFDGCKNSYQGIGKVGPLPNQEVVLNVVNVCADGSSMIRARVTVPVVGATYRFYRDGIKIAESNKLFTVISPAVPGVYTVKVISSTLPDSSCFKTSPLAGITVMPLGKISVTTPAAICSDVAVDLNTTVSSGSAGTFTFYKDKAMTEVVANPSAVGVAQTYYIKFVTTTVPICTSKDSVKITFKNCKPLGAIGDYVWLDKDADNTQSTGDTPIVGVKVYLLNASGTKIDSTTTGSDGKYLFSNLSAGTYTVQFVAPAGQSFVSPLIGGSTAKDSDAGTDGKSGLITLNPVLDPVTAADSANTFNFTIDAGLKSILGSIGDYVFLDKDNSGTQTASDTPVAGVKVYLLNATGTKIDSTFTGTDGKYLFSNLPLGTYSVQFVAPAGQSFVTPNTGTDVAIDSDAGTDGKSAQVTLTVTNKDILSLDAGLKQKYGSIGNYV